MDVLGFLAGLALFLFGMYIMGDALERVSGGKLESVLEKMTNKQYKGVLLGAAVTAVTQSSSAVTVMVVGFVNSGIMRLSRAVSIIMGANIGTTVTAWLLSLSGISSASAVLQIFKPSSFSPVLAVIGVFLLLFMKSPKAKNAGSVITGFAVLMLGMTYMSSAMSALSDNAAFTSMLVKFSNPFLGILVGAVLTAIIQSSSASVGILQALSLTGSVSFMTAFPIILGQNIGTCATTLISSIGTSKNAKRTALVHLYFNIIGVIVVGLVVYGINALVGGFSFAYDAISPVQIAIIHSSFNIISTLILLPFSKQLEFLATKSVRNEGKAHRRNNMIDENLLVSPSYTVERCRELTLKIADHVKECTTTAVNAINNYSPESRRKVKSDREQIYKDEEVIRNYLIRVSRETLTEKDTKKIFLIYHVLEDLEKCADYSAKIIHTRKKISDNEKEMSENAQIEVQVISDVLNELIETTLNAFSNIDLEAAKRAYDLEDSVDSLYRGYKKLHVERVDRGECSAELSFWYSDMLSSIEHIADHCCAISMAVLEIYGQNV